MTDPGTDQNQHPDLFGLLRGELSNAGVAVVAEHLDTCQHCRDELTEVAVGHALLAGATRTLSRPPALELPTPVTEAPDVPPPRWRKPLLLTAAASLLVAAGVGTATWVGQWREPDAPPVAGEPEPEPDAAADLDPLPGVQGSGQVLMAGLEEETTVMTIETRNLPPPGEGDYYYVWLFDPDTEKMLPVGQVGPEGSVSFRLTVSLLGRYSAIDVSLETDDGDPGHSLISVLHGEYGGPENAQS